MRSAAAGCRTTAEALPTPIQGGHPHSRQTPATPRGWLSQPSPECAFSPLRAKVAQCHRAFLPLAACRRRRPGQQPPGARTRCSSLERCFRGTLSTWCGTTSRLLPRGQGVSAWTWYHAPQVPVAPDVWRREHLQPTEVLSACNDGRENPARASGARPPAAGRSSSAVCATNRFDRVRSSGPARGEYTP